MHDLDVMQHVARVKEAEGSSEKDAQGFARKLRAKLSSCGHQRPNKIRMARAAPLCRLARRRHLENRCKGASVETARTAGRLAQSDTHTNHDAVCYRVKVAPFRHCIYFIKKTNKRNRWCGAVRHVFLETRASRPLAWRGAGCGSERSCACCCVADGLRKAAAFAALRLLRLYGYAHPPTECGRPQCALATRSLLEAAARARRRGPRVCVVDGGGGDAAAVEKAAERLDAVVRVGLHEPFNRSTSCEWRPNLFRFRLPRPTH